MWLGEALGRSGWDNLWIVLAALVALVWWEGRPDAAAGWSALAAASVFAWATWRVGALDLSGALAGALLAFCMGLFALRVSGLFFALLTLALAQMIYILASNKLRALTGGLDGIPGVPRPELLGVDFYDNRNYYAFVVVIFLAGLALMALLRASPFGKALRAVQANDTRASQLGYNVHALRQSAFVVSGAYAGVSGALLASLMFYISPQMLHWSTSGDVLIMTVLGGKGTLLGPILGVAVFELLKEELSQITQYWYGILGLIFIFATIFLRNGIAGLFHGRDDRDEGGAQ